MDEIRQALLDAWRRIAPALARDRDELRRRLARRQSKLIASPPRAWCLAVRATDTRLDRCCTSSPLQHSSFSIQHFSHQLLLDSRDLKKFCAPVHLPRGGLTLCDVQELLGVATAVGLLNARLNKVFATRYFHCPRGKPRPLFSCNRPLDPSARSFALADPVWSATAAHQRIPAGIETTLTRVPLYQKSGPHYRDTDGLHPEHPDRDPPPRRANKSKRLPPPPPDSVWYKWNGDQYIGYDWRRAQKYPQVRINYERHQARLAHVREYQQRRRRENPPPSKSQGSLKFRGWRWLCPICGRVVNLLFYPLPRWHLLPLPCRERAGERVEAHDRRKALARQTVLDVNAILAQADIDSRKKSPAAQRPGFACEKCHRIKRTSRCDPNAWNELVTYLSAGLLYGHEVKRPAWFPKPHRVDRMIECKEGGAKHAPLNVPEDRAPRGRDPSPSHPFTPSPPHSRDRKIAYTPRPNREPSKRRPQIEQLLLAGKTFKQIAAALGLAYGTILWHAQQVYKRHNVRTLADLLRKHGHAVPPPPTHEVRRRLLAGQSIPQIAAELGCGRMIIYNQRQQLRKKGHNLPAARPQNHIAIAKR